MLFKFSYFSISYNINISDTADPFIADIFLMDAVP